MTTNHKPATPLPWRYTVQPARRGRPAKYTLRGMDEGKDALYVAHAANAYPRLVEYVRAFAEHSTIYDQTARALLRELGEE